MSGTQKNLLDVAMIMFIIGFITVSVVLAVANGF